MTAPVKLYCSWFCPFAQRAWIALLEKDVAFEYVEIDPYNKTPEFLAINPRGLVPVIVQGDKSVFESSVCVEFVDEAWGSSQKFLPTDPWERANARILADYVNRRIVPTFYKILQMQEEEEQEKAKTEMLKHVEFVSKSMAKDGPFIMGDTFGLADITLVPFTLRFDILKKYRGFSVPESPEFDRFRAWMKACHARESIKKTLPDYERLTAKYQRYADNSAKTEVADAIRTGGTMP